MNKQLSMAYTVCRGVARAQAKNFYYAFLALPREKRNALCAVYAFMRHADDISDEPGLAPEQRHQQLQQWSEALHRTVAGQPTDDPIIMALADTQTRFRIPLEYFHQLVVGTAMDLQFEGHRPARGDEGVPLVSYANFDELYRYCYHVASVVGIVCIYIFGYKDKAAEQLAEKTGIAFQLTNIIRDVKEDALMGRIYIPAEELERFGRTAQELAPLHLRNGFAPSAFKPLLEFQAKRALEYYRCAEELIPLVNEDSRPCLWALVEIYRRTLEKIMARQYNVWEEKVRLTMPEKLNILMRGLLQVIR